MLEEITPDQSYGPREGLDLESAGILYGSIRPSKSEFGPSMTRFA